MKFPSLISWLALAYTTSSQTSMVASRLTTTSTEPTVTTEHHHDTRYQRHRKLATVTTDTVVLTNSYVIVFNETTVQDVTFKTAQYSGSLPSYMTSDAFITHEYNDAIVGLTMNNVNDELLTDLLDDPDVVRIVPVSFPRDAFPISCFFQIPGTRLLNHIDPP